MSRTQTAIAARETLGEDFFGGWSPEDVALFDKYLFAAEPAAGMITDFFGIKTRTEYHPWAHHLDGVVIGDIPIPDDSLRAEAIEYYAMLQSLETASPDRFAMAELGASYAPWACAAGVLAARTGRTDIRLIAVEASEYQFNLIADHLTDNDLDPNGENIRLLKGAVSIDRETLYFPRVSNPGENGGQAVSEQIDTDYVGRQVEHDPVQGMPIADILGDEQFDLVHIDIQGGEADVIASAIDLLNNQVRNLFIGTHSRLIEGRLLDLLHANGWALLRERPTKFEYCGDRESVIGWTTRDGGQFWTNLRKA